MTILDAVLILFLLCGAVLGFKKGAIKSLVGLIGTIAVIVLAYYLKNPIAELLFKIVPFFKLDGLVTLNILLYEGLAYLIVFAILGTILKILLKITGVIEFVLKATIILGIPSKIIGAVLGLVESVFFAFIILFVLSQFSITSNFVRKSSLANSILDKTPIVGKMVEDTYQAMKEIGDLAKKYDHTNNIDAYNGEILETMLKYEVVTPKVADRLIRKGKLDFAGASEIVSKYKEEKKND